MPPELLEVDEHVYPLGTPTCAAHHQAADIWGAACAAFTVLTGRACFLTDQSQPMEKQAVEVCQQHIELVSLPTTLYLSLFCLLIVHAEQKVYMA